MITQPVFQPDTATYRPARFFLLTFGITWACWFAAPLLGDPQQSDAVFLLLMLVGLLAPFASALYLTLSSGSTELRQDFFNKLLNIRLIRPASIPLFLILSVFLL